jgi:hypothetical protein
MPSPTPHRLSLDLPPLTAPQADALIQLLADLQDAFWHAYEDELLDGALDHTAAAEEVRLEADALDRALCDAPPDQP